MIDIGHLRNGTSPQVFRPYQIWPMKTYTDASNYEPPPPPPSPLLVEFILEQFVRNVWAEITGILVKGRRSRMMSGAAAGALYPVTWPPVRASRPFEWKVYGVYTDARFYSGGRGDLSNYRPFVWPIFGWDKTPSPAKEKPPVGGFRDAEGVLARR